MTKWWGNNIVLRGFETSEQSRLCTDGGMTTKHFALLPLEVAVEDSSIRCLKGQEELSISQNVMNIQMTWDSRPYFSQSGMGPESLDFQQAPRQSVYCWIGYLSYSNKNRECTMIGSAVNQSCSNINPNQSHSSIHSKHINANSAFLSAYLVIQILSLNFSLSVSLILDMIKYKLVARRNSKWDFTVGIENLAVR